MVAETPVRSALSFRLFLGDRTLGALNLYATQPDGFGREDIETGSIFAAHATVALAAVSQAEHLRIALRSRDVISMAKGILMARQDLGEDQAFDILRRASQRANVKLRVLAERVVHPTETADVDDPRPPVAGTTAH